MHRCCDHVTARGIAVVALLAALAVLATAKMVPVKNVYTEAEAEEALHAYRVRMDEYKRAREMKKTLGPDVEEMRDVLEIPTGWAASQLCSGIFVSGMDEDRVIEDDVDAARYFVDMFVDYEEKSTLAVLKRSGEYPYKSIFREGIGCTSIPMGVDEQAVRAQNIGNHTPLPPLNASAEWPEGEFVDLDNIPPEVDIEQLRQAVNDEFANPIFNVRAIAVVYKGKIVHEQYAPYLTKDSALIGWSMTKSVTGAMVGMLVAEGKLTLEQLAPVREWADPMDEHHNITINSMMHMSSGLLWTEEGVMLADCLFAEGADCAHYAAMQPLVYPIYSTWEYSTGTTTILSRIFAENYLPSRYNVFELYKRHLFDPLGMRSAVIEYAPEQYPVGGSLLFASARDWARFGLLYARGGRWIDGTQILSPEWVEYSCTPAPTTDGYGAQWWLNTEPDLRGICSMSGFRRQRVNLVPFKDLVIVSLRMPNMVQSPQWDEATFIRSIIACFPDVKK